eukprot:scaffold3535_cov148-Skeletonema_menzelii.AAC.2
MLPSKVEILLFLFGSASQVAESRLLSSSNRSSDTYITSYYHGQNANASNGHPYLGAFLGIVMSAAIFAGFIFLVDRETFDEVIGKRMKCTICRSVATDLSARTKCCAKPDIDDEDDGVPNTSPEYITPETAEYFSNKHDEEVEKPKRMWLATQYWVHEQSSKYLKKAQNFLPNSPLPGVLAKRNRTNNIDDDSGEDKYHIRDLEEIPSEEQTVEDKVAYQLWDIKEHIEDARIRMFWKPTKDLDKVMDGKDKYNVKGESQEYEIQCNSWFEEDPNAPWS